MFQVVDESGRSLIGFLTLFADFLRQATVMVPALMVQLDEPDIPFGETTRQQTIGCERARISGVIAILLEDVFWFSSVSPLR